MIAGSPEPKVCFTILKHGEGWSLRCFRRRGTQLAPENIPQQPHESPDFISSVKRQVERGTALTAVAFPASRSIIRVLKAPRLPPARLQRLVPTLLDVEIPFPVEESAFAVASIHRAADAAEILVAAVRRKDLQDFLGQTRQTTGLDPVIVDHEALAVWEECRLRQPPADRDCRLIAFRSGPRLLLISGSGDFPRAATTLDLTTGSEGQIPSDISRRIPGLLRQAAPSGFHRLQWIWCGEQIPVCGLDTLRTSLNLDIEEVHLSDSDLLAKAVARRALLPGGQSRFNLLSGDLKHPILISWENRRRIGLYTRFLGVSILIAALGLVFVARIHSLENQLAAKLRREASAISGISRVPAGQEVLIARRACRQRLQTLSPFREALSPQVSLLLRKLLEICRRRAIAVSDLVIGSDSARISGTGPPGADTELVTALQEAGFRAGVARRVDSGAGRIAFLVEGSR